LYGSGKEIRNGVRERFPNSVLAGFLHPWSMPLRRIAFAGVTEKGKRGQKKGSVLDIDI
jgi:hypothetical protein